MLPESTTIEKILVKVRERVDEPIPADVQKTAFRVPELHVVNSDGPVAGAVSPMPPVAPRPRADETSERPFAILSELDLVLASAVREAVSPVVAQHWVNNHEAELFSAVGPILQRWMDEHLKNHQAELIAALGPICQRWMDENLPRLVESTLKGEFRRRIHFTGRE